MGRQIRGANLQLSGLGGPLNRKIAAGASDRPGSFLTTLARVLIVESGARTAAAEQALAAAGYAVRSVAPRLAGDVVDALENVTIVAYLMGDASDPATNDEMLETVLLKVVDTGVRGFVYEPPTDAENAHVRHAIETWHLSVAELGASDDFGPALVAAANTSIGI